MHPDALVSFHEGPSLRGAVVRALCVCVERESKSDNDVSAFSFFFLFLGLCGIDRMPPHFSLWGGRGGLRFFRFLLSLSGAQVIASAVVLILFAIVARKWLGAIGMFKKGREHWTDWLVVGPWIAGWFLLIFTAIALMWRNLP
jgi:hypothetical protein